MDTSDAGRGILTASGRGPTDSVNVNVNDMGNNLYKVSFLPTEPGEYIIQLYYNGKEIGSSPFKMTVADPGKAVAHGEGTYIQYTSMFFGITEYLLLLYVVLLPDTMFRIMSAKTPANENAIISHVKNNYKLYILSFSSYF